MLALNEDHISLEWPSCKKQPDDIHSEHLKHCMQGKMQTNLKWTAQIQGCA